MQKINNNTCENCGKETNTQWLIYGQKSWFCECGYWWPVQKYLTNEQRKRKNKERSIAYKRRKKLRKVKK